MAKQKENKPEDRNKPNLAPGVTEAFDIESNSDSDIGPECWAMSQWGFCDCYKTTKRLNIKNLHPNLTETSAIYCWGSHFDIEF